MKTIAYIFYGIMTVLMVDCLGWFGWIFSGQQPIDGLYLGVITNTVLKYFLG